MAHVLVGHVAWRSFARPTTHINSVCPAISKGYLDSVQLLEHLGIASDDRLPVEKAVSMRSPVERRKLIDTA